MAHRNGLDVSTLTPELRDFYEHFLSSHPTDHKALADIVGLFNRFSITELKALFKDFVALVQKPEFFDPMKNLLHGSPIQTAMLAISLILLANPLAVVGFGTCGVTAGTLATEWQSTMGGHVASGSAFAILQSLGARLGFLLPVTGAALIATGALAVVFREQIRDGVVVASAAGDHIGKWGRGEYGEPVKHWLNGEYGNPVTSWWNGEYGNPVWGWAKTVIEDAKKQNKL